MKIVIAGTGAMGATYGIMLKKLGHEVIFLDNWDLNIKMINENGINFNNLGNKEKILTKAYFPKEYKGDADLIIIFTKSMQLKNMLENIKHIIKDNTMVMCLLNGLGHWETLKDFVKEENIIMGVTVMTASSKGAANFECSNYGTTEIQGLNNLNEKFVKEIVKIFNDAKLDCVYSNNIMYSIWRKACLNGFSNPLSTILECNMIGLSKVPNLEDLIKNIVLEFSLIAKKYNVNIDVKEISKTILWFTSKEFKGHNHFPSMYQDLILHKRYTEIDYLNGFISKKGKEFSIDTKYCDLLTKLIKTKENLLIK